MNTIKQMELKDKFYRVIKNLVIIIIDCNYISFKTFTDK